MKNTCKLCGKMFESPKAKHYCSWSCENRGRHKQKLCAYCGKAFRPSSKNTATCSISCGKMYQLRDYDRKRQLVECSTCGKVFEKREIDIAKTDARGGKHYCSRTCAGVGLRKRVSLVCSECGKAFERAASGTSPNNKHHFCSKECQAKNTDYILSGKDHYRYIDGETSYKRGQNWLEQRRFVRERDGYTCRFCGITEAELGKALDVHHQRPYRLFDNYAEANALDNLIALCPSCHHREDAQIILRQRN